MNTVKLHFVLAATLLCGAFTAALAQQPTPLLAKPADELLGVLKSEGASHKEKADACRQLGVLGGKDAVPVLAALLTDEKLSHMARYGLEPNPDPSVDKVFRDALKTLTGRPLVGVIISIGVRKDAEAVQPLAELLRHSQADVVQAAARSLGNIANPAAVEALQRALEGSSGVNQIALCEGLFRCAEALRAQGERRPAVAIYDRVRSLNSAPHQVRTGALRGAILARGRRGAALLREQLLNDDYLLFAAAVRTAYEMPGAAATEALAAQLPQISDADRQLLVIQALGKRTDPAALPPLTKLAKSGAKPIRIAAVKALAETGNPAAASGLVEVLDGEDREVAQAALESLASLQGQEVDDTVKSMLNSREANRRAAAIELIERRRMTDFVPELLKAANDSDSKVRSAALSTVGELGNPSHVQPVLDLLPKLETSDNLDAAEQALTALGAKSERREAIADQLTKSFNQAQPNQKAALLRVLGSVGTPTALETVRTALKDSNPEVHAAAIRSLGAWKTADAAPDLLELAKNASNPTEQTLSLRGFLGLAANPDIRGNERLSMCREAATLAKSDEEKRLLLGALSSIDSPGAAAMSARYLNDDATKEEASAAVAAIADRLLKGQRSERAAPRLIEPLETAAKTTTNQDLSKRITALLEQARAKAPTQ